MANQQVSKETNRGVATGTATSPSLNTTVAPSQNIDAIRAQRAAPPSAHFEALPSAAPAQSLEQVTSSLRGQINKSLSNPLTLNPSQQRAVVELALGTTDREVLLKDQRNVAVIQALLARSGYLEAGNVDGHMGPRTKKALTDFQYKHVGKVTGDIGSRTAAALLHMNPTSSTDETLSSRIRNTRPLFEILAKQRDESVDSLSPAERKIALKTALRDLGHLKIDQKTPVNDTYSNTTAEAIRSFQAASGLPTDANCGLGTTRELLKQYTLGAPVPAKAR